MTDASEPLVGDVLAERYRLVAQVGQGGMARVFRADDTALGRTVAVKVLRPGVEGAVSAPERARSEVTLLASLNHPSLVTLFDAHLAGSPEYLVMEFVEGPTLSGRIAEGPLPPAEVAALAAEMGEALHVVHGSGVVHRDVKPSNVLLAPPHLPGGRSRAKLADFGIALLLDSARVTTPGTVIGTAAYLAPEQVKGGDPSPASDVYALGLVLLEALTGERAYPNTDGVGAALARLSAPPTIPDELGPGWGSLLTRMTATSPSDRPTSLEVVEAAERLRTAPVDGAPPLPPVRAAVAAGIPVAAAAAAEPATRRYPIAETVALTSPDPAPQKRSRRPLVIALTVGAVALIAAASIWTASLAGAPQPTSSDPAQTEPRSTEPVQDTVTDPTPASSAEPSPAPSAVTTDDAPADNADDQAVKDAEKAAKEAEKKAAEDAKRAEREAEKGPKDKPDKP
ncbi:serine/threonine-protein kinase [Microbacterium oleivorans]|uniref:Serine/threonine protein kinase n=1 Tax=Microbacterium oleivorans TaxID=273677 RepID=A0A031FY51_9MICO|nr:serine/threonine-protein kinase [Microbacterium oleivorans]EZP29131.1 Serine/threonine protein kinase [Microbacterium oleivorans]